MKCEVCLELLEEYLDGEVAVEQQEQISAHLITCADCAAGFSALSAEQQLFSRYDRELEVPPFLWARIAHETVAGNNSIRAGWRARVAGLFAMPAFAGAVAVLLIGVAIGAFYLRKTDSTLSRKGSNLPQAVPKATMTHANKTRDQQAKQADSQREVVAPNRRRIRKAKPATRVTLDQSDVLSTDLGYPDIDDRDTARHIEQTQILLRSIRNVRVSDGDEEIDVSYDKALSRRLLNENVVLRRDAEMKAKFPTKTLLADLEPFLIDIANLPDHARPEDVRAIKDRVQKTEIVAALMGYQDRGPNNR